MESRYYVFFKNSGPRLKSAECNREQLPHTLQFLASLPGLHDVEVFDYYAGQYLLGVEVR